MAPTRTPAEILAELSEPIEALRSAVQALDGSDDRLVKLRATVLHFCHVVTVQDNEVRAKLIAAQEYVALLKECNIDLTARAAESTHRAAVLEAALEPFDGLCHRLAIGTPDRVQLRPDRNLLVAGWPTVGDLKRVEAALRNHAGALAEIKRQAKAGALREVAQWFAEMGGIGCVDVSCDEAAGHLNARAEQIEKESNA